VIFLVKQKVVYIGSTIHYFAHLDSLDED